MFLIPGARVFLSLVNNVRFETLQSQQLEGSRCLGWKLEENRVVTESAVIESF